MWVELLRNPKWIGGTLTDDDAPSQPTRIVKAGLVTRGRQTFVQIEGDDFTWECDRRHCGITGRAPAQPPEAIHIVATLAAAPITGCTIRPKQE